MIRQTFAFTAALAVGLAPAAITQPDPAAAQPPSDATAHQAAADKVPVSEGYLGAVSTVDHDATKAGIRVLRHGGNAVDAAVAAAATLGVTEPFSAGIGGGGFFVYYDAATGEVHTIDGRETAPSAADESLFLDEQSGEPLPFEEARVSGLSIGTPGTPATWQAALDAWGTRELPAMLRPAIRVAEHGFEVDQTYHDQIAQNQDIFDDFTSSSELFLPDGAAPEVGSTFRNPELADTYRQLASEGVAAMYGGELGAELAATVQQPPVGEDADRTVRPGSLTADDVADYEVRHQEPTRVDYRGLEVYGMAPVSSGGSTVGEALNILEGFDGDDQEAFLHAYLEASSLAFADRNRYVGDPSRLDVPLDGLLAQSYADQRRCLIDPERPAPKPVAPGVPAEADDVTDGGVPGEDCAPTAPAGSAWQPGGTNTTHLTTSDRWGNVVAYTLTIESTGGSGIVVPDRGYLLNNELTDFNFAPTQGDAPDPNLPGPQKRPRSSMSPTIVLSDGAPLLALGSPGGATIIPTVLQTLVNRIDLGYDLPGALAAPRLSPMNDATRAEPAFLESDVGRSLSRMGHEIDSVDEIGAATALEFGRHGRVQAVAEPERRGGGSAMTVLPVPR